MLNKSPTEDALESFRMENPESFDLLSSLGKEAQPDRKLGHVLEQTNSY